MCGVLPWWNVTLPSGDRAGDRPRLVGLHSAAGRSAMLRRPLVGEHAVAVPAVDEVHAAVGDVDVVEGHPARDAPLVEVATPVRPRPGATSVGTLRAAEAWPGTGRTRTRRRDPTARRERDRPGAERRVGELGGVVAGAALQDPELPLARGRSPSSQAQSNASSSRLAMISSQRCSSPTRSSGSMTSSTTSQPCSAKNATSSSVAGRYFTPRG